MCCSLSLLFLHATLNKNWKRIQWDLWPNRRHNNVWRLIWEHRVTLRWRNGKKVQKVFAVSSHPRYWSQSIRYKEESQMSLHLGKCKSFGRFSRVAKSEIKIYYASQYSFVWGFTKINVMNTAQTLRRSARFGLITYYFVHHFNPSWSFVISFVFMSCLPKIWLVHHKDYRFLPFTSVSNIMMMMMMTLLSLYQDKLSHEFNIHFKRLSQKRVTVGILKQS